MKEETLFLLGPMLNHHRKMMFVNGFFVLVNSYNFISSCIHPVFAGPLEVVFWAAMAAAGYYFMWCDIRVLWLIRELEDLMDHVVVAQKVIKKGYHELH